MAIDIKKELGISPRYWRYLLSGKRNASATVAEKINLKLGIGKEVFMFGTSVKRRQEWANVVNMRALEEKNNPPAKRLRKRPNGKKKKTDS